MYCQTVLCIVKGIMKCVDGVAVVDGLIARLRHHLALESVESDVAFVTRWS
jgi:hypothetical protein